MIVIDTNVVSELSKPDPSAAVYRWFDANGPSAALPTPALGELYYGVYKMSPGRRREAILRLYDDVVARLTSRILPFDQSAAMVQAELVADCEKRGRTLNTIDSQIAAIAKVHNCALATRDVRDFSATGLKLINPWEDKS